MSLFKKEEKTGFIAPIYSPCDHECPSCGNTGHLCGLPEYPDLKVLAEAKCLWKCHSYNRICHASLEIVGPDANLKDYSIVDDFDTVMHIIDSEKVQDL